MGELVMLTVPAIVLTTRRAWAITESASARGFGSPHRRPYRELHMRARDWIAITAAVSLMACLIGL
jgi:energy-coupling factor transporter transmembrane protein EcfT